MYATAYTAALQFSHSLGPTAVVDCALPGFRERDAPSIVLPHQDANYISHIALDIGGSLIKLVYFSSDKPDARTRSASSNIQSGTGGDCQFG